MDALGKKFVAFGLDVEAIGTRHGWHMACPNKITKFILTKGGVPWHMKPANKSEFRQMRGWPIEF